MAAAATTTPTACRADRRSPNRYGEATAPEGHEQQRRGHEEHPRGSRTAETGEAAAAIRADVERFPEKITKREGMHW